MTDQKPAENKPAESKPVMVDCPTCGKPVEWRADNRFRPFCSERCKQIDLGAWANEEYRVPASPSDQEGGPPT